MVTARISSKGQITLPSRARRAVGIETESRVEVDVRDGEIIIRPIKSVSEVGGMLRKYAEGKTTDWGTIRTQTEQAIAEEVAREGRD